MTHLPPKGSLRVMPAFAWLIAVYAGWLGALFWLAHTTGKGLYGIAFALLLLFVWAPSYVFWNRDDLWIRNKTATLTFAVTIAFFALPLWGFFSLQDGIETRRGEETMIAYKQMIAHPDRVRTVIHDHQFVDMFAWLGTGSIVFFLIPLSTCFFHLTKKWLDKKLPPSQNRA